MNASVDFYGFGVLRDGKWVYFWCKVMLSFGVKKMFYTLVLERFLLQENLSYAFVLDKFVYIKRFVFF